MTASYSLDRFATRRTALRSLLAAGITVIVPAWLAGCSTPPLQPAPMRGLTPAQKTALRQLNFTESSDADWNLDLGARVAFGVDVTSITPDGATELARVAQVLLSVGIDRLTVEGHADNAGTEVYNQRLSERRAEVVAETLVTNGFSLANITRRGYGSSRSVAANDTPVGRLQNRRAVLIVPSL